MMMFKRNKKKPDRVNRLGAEVLRAALPSDGEIERAAASPFLFARVRAEIESRRAAQPVVAAEARSREPAGLPFAFAIGKLQVWLAALLVAAAAAFWTVRARSGVEPAPDTSSNAGITACSLSSKDKCVISTNDVVELLMNGNSRELGK